MKTKYCYLLHFSRPLCHAKHYLGSAVDYKARVALHQSGKSDVNIIRVAHSRGITFTLARIWRGGRKKERSLKGRSLVPLCPICQAINTPTSK